MSSLINVDEINPATAAEVSIPFVTNVRTIHEKLRDTISVKDYGAIGNGITNDTIAIQAAVDAAHTSKLGNIYFPPGTYAWTTVTKDWTHAFDTQSSVNIIGAGSKATFFKKFSGTDPMFNFSTSGSNLELYSRFQGFSIEGGSKTYDGIKMTSCAFVTFDDVNLEDCDKAIHCLGSLVFTIKNSVIRLNNIGLYARKDTNNVRPNFIGITDSVISQNSSFGVDYGDGSALSLCRVDMEQNGTTVNTGTGAIMLRDTIDDDASNPYGQVTLADVWFEGNLGITLQSEATAQLVLNMDNVKFLSDESNNAMNIRSGAYVSMNCVVCHVGTITLAGNASSIRNSVIATLTDTSTQQTRDNVYTSSFSGGTKIPVIATASAPVGAAGEDGRILIETVGAGDANLIIYAGGQKFRIDGGVAV